MKMSHRLSYGDEEDIVVKPSTELIADEYEHSTETTNNIAVHTFASRSIKDQDNVTLFVETLKKNDYEIKSENAHCLENDNIYEILQNISTYTETSKTVSGLILYFSGFCQEEGKLDVYDGSDIVSIPIQEIWNRFTSYSCRGLKNRPKIFTFHITSPSTIETDSRKYVSTTYEMAYETPAEADILIIYNKTESMFQRDFTEQLCDNISRYGKIEDIVSLVTCIDSIVFENRPMIISTLTRKFYFTVSESRGYHFFIDENNDQLVNDLKEVDEKLSQVNSHLEKKRKLFSFNLGRKNSTKKKETSNNVISEEKPEALKRDTTVRNSTTKSTIINSRNRKPSQAESDGRRSITKISTDAKPRWR